MYPKGDVSHGDLVGQCTLRDAVDVMFVSNVREVSLAQNSCEQRALMIRGSGAICHCIQIAALLPC